ncbi:MAG: hypothetical protein LC650_05270, partial [Actinobacteria bacterium]|nr:hypothetical protein [Actinomycetota bacterium]
MKDFLEQTLEIDDRVIMFSPGRRDFSLAKVVAFTSQNVRVALRNPGKTTIREMKQKPKQLV